MTEITVSQLQDDEQSAWDEYVIKKCAGIHYDTEWRGIIKRVFGHNSYYLVAKNDGEICGVLPLIRLKSILFGDYLVSMPFLNYGGVLADDHATEGVLIAKGDELRKQLGCTHIELRDIKDSGAGLPQRVDKVSMLLELPTEPDELWKSIGAKRRAQVKRPIREGVSFETGGLELLDSFYYVFSINMRDLGTPVYSKSFFRDILTTFPNNAKLAIVNLDDEAVGAGFLLGRGGQLEIPWASTLRKVNKISVNMFLYWNVLKYAIEQKYKVFDFGRSSKDSGTLKFKRQWGAVEKQLYWHYIQDKNSPIPGLNPNNPKYKYAISLWKKLPVPVANMLGPAIVKGLP